MKLATRAMTNAEIKQYARLRAAGIIESVLDGGVVAEYGLSEQDAKRVEEEMTRIVARLRGEKQNTPIVEAER